MIDFSRTTALFGGSFDPVHEGHLHVARSIQSLHPEMQIVFVPAALSPGKSPPLASFAQRLDWLSKTVEPLGFQVWDTEGSRPGESYTVDTLEEAHKRGASSDRLYWILGADAYKNFDQWRSPQRIRQLARLIVVNRPGSPLQAQNAEDLIVPIDPHPARSTTIREALRTKPEEAQGLPPPVDAEIKRLILRSQNPYARKCP